MTNEYSEEIFKTTFFTLTKKDASLIFHLNQDNNVLISSWLNGGIHSNMSSVVNQTIEGEDYNLLMDADYEGFQLKTFEKLGLIPDKSAGLMTSACMDNYAISCQSYEQLNVVSVVTAGADHNGIKVGDSASFYEYNNKYFNHFGTINIFTLIDANLHEGALITASITATEAKTSVLQDLKIESQFSNNICTGTGTDGICIVSNKNSDNNIENAGKHSKLGELIAKSVIEATTKALYYQTFMSKDFQNTVLSRLSRFNVDFDTFYKSSNIDNIIEYASTFYSFNINNENISFVSSIINLIDEVQLGLLELPDIEKIVKILINTYLHIDVSNKKIDSINELINLLINSINLHLFD